MKKDNFSKIIGRFLSKRFSNETEEKVQRWIINNKNEDEKEHASLEYWNALNVEPNDETYSALERVNRRIGYSQKRIVMIPLYKKIGRVAAVLVPLIIVASYLYFASNQNDMVEISVAYGGQKHLFLPDSSEIWVNAGSTIKYPKNFNRKQRMVHLDGEAYFSVRRDETKPFIVQTEQLSVKVLGTKFNVKAYSSDDKSTTTLTSGKVEVATNRNDARILMPNEQLTFDYKSATMSVVEIPSNETNGWVTGQLIFTNASFDEIIHTLERRFNVSVTAGKHFAETSDKLYTVKFLKNENLDTILAILKDVIGIPYQRNGNEIIFK